MTNDEYMSWRKSMEIKIKDLDTAICILRSIKGDYHSQIRGVTSQLGFEQIDKTEKYNV